MNILTKIPNTLALSLIRVYRFLFSPSVGVFRFLPFYPKPTCIFFPTCSEYARLCFEKFSFPVALVKTVKRIGRCHPGNTPEIDYP